MQSTESSAPTHPTILVLGLMVLAQEPFGPPAPASHVTPNAAAAKGTPLFGAVLLAAYAVGHGLPLLILGTFAGAAARMRQVGQWMPTIQKGSGWVLVGVAFYLVLTA